MLRDYRVVDAFSDRPLLGNPVAVILNAEGLDTAQMQAVARWTNLSETTFVLPPSTPEADYRLRIFTPGSELPFAGHPTLGTAHALIEAGLATPREGKVVQECGVGLVDVAIQNIDGQTGLALTMPEARFTPLSDEDAKELALIMGTRLNSAPISVDVGPVWLVAETESPEDLLALTPDYDRCAALERRLGITGVSLFARTEGENIEVRSFAPSCGVNEDPVCGSGNGAIAAYRRHTGQMPAASWAYSSQQGRCVGREGQISLSVDAKGKLTVGGQCITTVRGTINI